MINRRHLTYICLFLWPLGLISCHPEGQERTGNMNPEIIYWTNAADEMFPTELLISSDGIANLKIPTGRKGRDSSVVGLFRARLADSQLKPLISALKTREFAEIQNPKSLVEGEVMRKLSIKEQDKPQVTKLMTANAPRSPVFLEAEKAALDLIAVVSKKPVYAVRIELANVPQLIRKSDAVRPTVVLINSGSEPIQIPGPQSWDQQKVQMTIEAIRSDIPAEQLSSKHQRFEKVLKDDVETVQAITLSKEFIILKPAERATLVLKKNLDWPAGNYRVKILFLLPLFDSQKQPVLRCEAVSQGFVVSCL
jgi:hypothetical protein